MPDKRAYLVKNLSRIPAYVGGKPIGPVYEYVSRSTDHAQRGTPVAFSLDFATEVAKQMGLDPNDAVVLVPDDMIVVLDNSARKLPQTTPVALAQFETGLLTV